jgi:hypothetical protein
MAMHHAEIVARTQLCFCAAGQLVRGYTGVCKYICTLVYAVLHTHYICSMYVCRMCVRIMIIYI